MARACGRACVAQELLTQTDHIGSARAFWMKEGGGGSAEVDFIWNIDAQIIPVEVKNGNNSHLRSLHSFIDAAPVDIGVRVWSAPFSVDDVQTTIRKKSFRLINLPFYLTGSLEKIVRKVIS